MSSDRKPVDPVDPGSGDNQGHRPKYDNKDKASYFVNDEVYLRVGSDLTGPYLIAQVVRTGVYILSDEFGNTINNGAEFSQRHIRRR